MKKTDTWMPLYIGDYLADTSRLTTEQHGVYLLLLMDYWRNGPPPDDDAVLASISKLSVAQWKRHGPTIRTFFRVEDGLLLQGRAEVERAKANGISGKRSAAGKAGAGERWAKGKLDASAVAKPVAKPVANAIANASQTDAPSQSPKPIEKEQETAELPLSVSPPPPFDGKNFQILNGKSVVKLSSGWELPERWGIDAEALGWTQREVLFEAEKFRQYWTSGGGAGRTKNVHNWRQAWSNWLGKAAKDKQR